MAKRKNRKRKRARTTRNIITSDRRHPIFVVIKLENACRENAVPPQKVDGYFRRVYKLIKQHAPRAAIAVLVRCIIEELKRYLR